MSNAEKVVENGAGRPSRYPAVVALVAVLALECAALVLAAAYLVFELVTASSTSFASAVGITVLVAITAVWVGFVARGVLRGQAWTRAAIVVIQVLIAAVAIGSFHGESARPELGLLLLVPAIAALVLLFTRPVLAATTARDRESRTF